MPRKGRIDERKGTRHGMMKDPGSQTRENDDDDLDITPYDYRMAGRSQIISGVYSLTSVSPPVSPFIPEIPQLPDQKRKVKGTISVDVDGYYPQMTVSGSFSQGIKAVVYWIAQLKADKSPNSWTGNIWYKYPDGHAFRYKKVQLTIEGTTPVARVIFSGQGSSDLTCTYKLKSRYFHPAKFEFDWEQNEAPTTSIETWAHPNRPDTLAHETLTIQKVYQRAGFNATQHEGGAVPGSEAGSNAKWSDIELHDAMQSYWSAFKDKPQWSIWVFFASLHDMGSSLGGIMFDEIGPNHRQGCAIFGKSFISLAPSGDPNPTAWKQRMAFWTACHEMGHCFNLAHSWQKSLDASWIPLSDEDEARSFMNYPYNVSGGEQAFFSDFEYRFSDQELLFLRHAPSPFVQPGNAAWFDNHGFEGANELVNSKFNLVLRANRDVNVFEYMEPVTLELKLTNVTHQPQVVKEKILSDSDQMTVIVQGPDGHSREYVPYAHRCWSSGMIVLDPEESLYESLYIYSGTNGWDIAKPGNYMVQVALHLGDGDLLSNPLHVQISPPKGEAETLLSGDFFTDSVGRILAFDGSHVLTSGNDTLRKVRDQLGNRRIGLHANYILGNEVATDSRVLTTRGEGRLAFDIKKAVPKEAEILLRKSLIENTKTAVESFGHIDYKYYTDKYSDWLSGHRKISAAVHAQEVLYDTLAARRVHGRKVLDSVLQGIEDKKAAYTAKR